MNDYYVHESSVIDAGAVIGKSTKIWHFCHISSSAVIGANCIFGQNVYIGPNVRIGDGVKIQNNVSVYEGVTLEDEVFIGPSVVFTNVVEPKSYVEQKDQFLQTIVRTRASIGANSTIICGNTIGIEALVGAGSVVTKHVPDKEMWFDNPARFVRRIT